MVFRLAYCLVDDLLRQSFCADVVDEFNRCEDGWVLGSALGAGFDFDGIDGCAHLAAEHQRERVSGAGSEAGKKHFKRSGLLAGHGWVVHGEKMLADSDVDAHVCAMKGANG